ncbi:MAG: dephospho-CoA kinase [Woeseia sp.]
MKRPLRIGLTGGIASGKTTVAEFFAGLGVPVIDTDVIARELVEPGKPALDEIRVAFGDDVIDADGRLNRGAMRELVFSDEVCRAKLESILHPRIREEAMTQSRAAGGPYQIIVVPLLAESPIRKLMDRVLVVDCDEDTQLRRLLARDAQDETRARRIMAAQAGRQERLAIADDVIANNDDLSGTRQQVAALHEKYLSQKAVICPE